MLNEIPSDAIMNLANSIKKHKNALKMLAGMNKNISFNIFGSKNIIYLDEGRVNLHRIKDNVLLHNIEAPFIIGLEQMFSNSDFYYIKPINDVSLYLLSHDEAIDNFDRGNLWKDIVQLMSYFIGISEHRSHFLAENRSVYDIVKINLEVIWNMPEKERETTSVFNYILRRHKISRSSIAKIIKELNSGKYITTKRGILVNLNKLPSKF